jgi:hypothetical protein
MKGYVLFIGDDKELLAALREAVTEYDVFWLGGNWKIPETLNEDIAGLVIVASECDAAPVFKAGQVDENFGIYPKTFPRIIVGKNTPRVPRGSHVISSDFSQVELVERIVHHLQAVA